MDETLPVNIAEGAGAHHVAWHVERATHVASVQIGVFTGKVSSIHSTRAQSCRRVVEGLEMCSGTRGMATLSQALCATQVTESTRLKVDTRMLCSCCARHAHLRP